MLTRMLLMLGSIRTLSFSFREIVRGLSRTSGEVWASISGTLCRSDVCDAKFDRHKADVREDRTHWRYGRSDWDCNVLVIVRVNGRTYNTMALVIASSSPKISIFLCCRCCVPRLYCCCCRRRRNGWTVCSGVGLGHHTSAATGAPTPYDDDRLSAPANHWASSLRLYQRLLFVKRRLPTYRMYVFLCHLTNTISVIQNTTVIPSHHTYFSSVPRQSILDPRKQLQVRRFSPFISKLDSTVETTINMATIPGMPSLSDSRSRKRSSDCGQLSWSIKARNTR